jgi:LacI family transcriptional regulator
MEIVERARAIKADAIFGRWNGINKKMIDQLGIPIVLRTGSVDYPYLPMLTGDYTEIGRMAAEYFYKHHYYNYAFLGYSEFIWSEERLIGFKDFLEKKNMIVHSFTTELANSGRNSRMRQWLQNLPKPIALFAANDVLANAVAETCQEAGIDVPREIAILGADNDDFLCNIVCPTISSINLDFERQGRELGAAIYKMRQEGSITPVRIILHPIDVRERGSTVRYNIQDPYVRQILDYIDMNYTLPISIKDIIRDIPLSRRALEMRFKKEMDPETILSYLFGLRVKDMCHYLSSTDMPVSHAAERSGFTDVFNVGRTFKRFTGMSPAQYRKKCKQAASGTPDNSNPGDKED